MNRNRIRIEVRDDRVEIAGSFGRDEWIDFIEHVLEEAEAGRGGWAVDCGDPGESTCIVHEEFASRMNSIDAAVFDPNLPLVLAHRVASIGAMVLNVLEAPGLPDCYVIDDISNEGRYAVFCESIGSIEQDNLDEQAAWELCEQLNGGRPA